MRKPKNRTERQAIMNTIFKLDNSENKICKRLLSKETVNIKLHTGESVNVNIIDSVVRIKYV